MSVTYTNETKDSSLDSEAPYIPAYARSRQARKSKGGIKTWMILAPIGVLAVGGIGAAMMFGGDQAPVVEAEATTPAPIASQPLQSEVVAAPMTSAATPASINVASAPVARETAPTREAAPVRRAAPRASAPVATPRVEAAPVLTGPQPYSAAPSAMTTTPTSTLNRAPVVATPAAPAPVIVVQPAG